MKYVLTYQSIEDFGPLFSEHGEAHLQYLKSFHDRGLLLMMGPLQEPFNGDALAVFVSKESAEEFAGADPIVIHGLIKSWQVRPWQEVLVPEPV